MKEKKIMIMALAVMLSASVFADLYYNNKTFNSSEATGEKVVYIGHGSATDGGSASDALVTVKDDATWTVGEAVYLGNVAGMSRLFIESNAKLDITKASAYLYAGCVAGASTVITNKGVLSTPRISLGEKASAGECIFYNQSGAILNVKDASTYAFYVGGRAPAKLISSGEILLPRDGIMRLGGGITTGGDAMLVMNNSAKIVTGKNIWMGFTGTSNSNVSEGKLELNDESQINMTGDLSVGYGNRSKCEVKASDNSKIEVVNVNVGQGQESSGSVVLCGNSVLEVRDNFKLASSSSTDITAFAAVSNNAIIVATNILVAGNNKANCRAELELADNGCLTNVHSLYVGRGSTALGILKITGGSVKLASAVDMPNHIVRIGNNGAWTCGIIRGYGTIAFDDPLLMLVNYGSLGRSSWGSYELPGGMVIADGGVLDWSRGPVQSYVAGDYNSCMTSGYYAVNSGILKFPRGLPRKTASHSLVGIDPDYSEEPLYVNSFRYTFDTATMNTTNTYVFSELYAVDRDDIPAGLPTGKGIHHSAVWRIGHFNASATPDVDDEDLTADHKQNFTSLKLRFHYDPALAEIEGVRHVKVYRCADSVNGGWKCVASITAPNSALPYIETVEMAPSSELWNCGWFAIVGTPRVGAVMVVR